MGRLDVHALGLLTLVALLRGVNDKAAIWLFAQAQVPTESSNDANTTVESRATCSVVEAQWRWCKAGAGALTQAGSPSAGG